MAASVPEVTIGPVDAFWRYRRRSIPAVVIVALVAALAALWSGGEAVAVTAVHLTDPRGVPMFRDGTTAATDLEAYAAQRAEFATSDGVVRATADALGEPVPVVRDMADASATAGSRIAIECRDNDAELALSVCTALADAYVELSRADTARRAEVALASLRTTRQTLIDQRLARQPDAAPSSGAIEQIEVQIAQTALKAALFDAGVEFVDAPLLVGSSPLRTAARTSIAAIALATLAAAGIAWAASVRRPMIDDPELASAHLGAPLLGHLTEVGSSVEAVADDLATMRPRGILVVTTGAGAGTDTGLAGAELPSAGRAGTGTTDVVDAIAVAWAREGRTVVVVDGRPDAGRLSQRLGAPTTGLTDVVAGMASLDDTIIRIGRPSGGTGVAARVHVLGSGRPVDHLASLLRSPRAHEVFSQLRSAYDLVVIDAPSLLDSGDGPALAAFADGLVVLLANRTPWRRIIALRQRLDVLRAPLVGVVAQLGHPHQTTNHVTLR
jgi:hypothetical protein